MGCAVVLRTVNRGHELGRPRAPRGEAADQLQILGWSAIVVLPVPKRSSPSSAMATISKLVRASFSGTCTWARPWASSGTTGCHSSKVSNNSRVLLRPPPPPGLRLSARSGVGPRSRTGRCGGAHAPVALRHSPSAKFQVVLGISSSRALSTAAMATWACAAGCPSARSTWIFTCTGSPHLVAGFIGADVYR